MLRSLFKKLDCSNFLFLFINSSPHIYACIIYCKMFNIPTPKHAQISFMPAQPFSASTNVNTSFSLLSLACLKSNNSCNECCQCCDADKEMFQQGSYWAAVAKAFRCAFLQPSWQWQLLSSCMSYILHLSPLFESRTEQIRLHIQAW